MASLVRFGVSLRKELSDEFDRHIQRKNCPTRSKAIADLIREDLIKKQLGGGRRPVAGVITIIYDHHRRELVNRLLDIQHGYQDMIVSTQHVHLSHDSCLEVIIVKGKPRKVQELADTIKSEKGVMHGYLTMTTGGK